MTHLTLVAIRKTGMAAMNSPTVDPSKDVHESSLPEIAARSSR